LFTALFQDARGFAGVGFANLSRQRIQKVIHARLFCPEQFVLAIFIATVDIR